MTHINQVYDRTDPRGFFPSPTNFPSIEHNRLAIFWRPLIDMRQSQYAPMRLQAIQYVNEWLSHPESREWSWLARHSVPGLRNQVIRHAGLLEYSCHDPRELREDLRSPAWDVLVDAMNCFRELAPHRRKLVVFHLVQLSFNRVALALSAEDQPDGSNEMDSYMYEVGRAAVALSPNRSRAQSLFEYLSTSAADPVLRLAASAQGISHALRSQHDLKSAHRFARYGTAVAEPGDDRDHILMASRFHRALALLHMREKDFPATYQEVMRALKLSDQLYLPASQLNHTGLSPDEYVLLENRRIVLESLINAVSRAPDPQLAGHVRERCEELIGIDPFCIHARIVAADGYAAIGEYETAARWYARAGELGTGAGAMAWYRAGQCFEVAGRSSDAVNAMGRCLELDSTAIQPRQYLEAVSVGQTPSGDAPRSIIGTVP